MIVKGTSIYIDTAIRIQVIFLIVKKQGEWYLKTRIIPFMQPYRYESHRCRKLIALSAIIVVQEQIKQKNMK